MWPHTGTFLSAGTTGGFDRGRSEQRQHSQGTCRPSLEHAHLHGLEINVQNNKALGKQRRLGSAQALEMLNPTRGWGAGKLCRKASPHLPLALGKNNAWLGMTLGSFKRETDGGRERWVLWSYLALWKVLLILAFPSRDQEMGQEGCRGWRGLQGAALALTSSGNYLEGWHGVGLHVEAGVASLVEGSVVRLL